MSTEKMLKIGAALILVAVIVGGVVAFAGRSDDGSESQTTSQTGAESADELDEGELSRNENGTMLSYQGQEGKTALEVLEELADVGVEESDFGPFVTSINDVEGGGEKFWLFYVNGEAAQVGAGEYETSADDQIEWRLE